MVDCLVLKLEECDVNRDKIDNTAYILYDTYEQTYIIRGQRQETNTRAACTYSFTCDDENSLADFLLYMICSHNTVNEVLYNYDNLPDDCNKITFEFLAKYDDPTYEISGYDAQKLRRKTLLRNLRMLKNVFNYYN
jgi:acetone carboxylase gamma subunit